MGHNMSHQDWIMRLCQTFDSANHHSKYQTTILDQQLKRSKPNILSVTDGISIVHFDMDSDEIEVWHQNGDRFDIFTKTIPDLSFPVAVFNITETEYNPTEPDPIPDIKLFMKSPIDRRTKVFESHTVKMGFNSCVLFNHCISLIF